MNFVAIWLLLVGLCTLAVIVALLWRRVVQPHRRRAAAALLAEVQLQLLTQAALAAMLDEARHHLLHGEQRAS